MLPMTCDELALFTDENHENFVYVDEVGRGCLAGPVCAAVVMWPPSFTPCDLEEHRLLEMIRDSKKLSEKQRLKLEGFIKTHAIEYKIATIDNTEIDDLNILQATYKAMHQALDGLTTSFSRIVVDGNRFKQYISQTGQPIPHTCIVGGDNKLLQIAAASILAKVHRDRLITELSAAESQALAPYKFEKNKGYGTKEHLQALQKHGPSAYHRRTFIKRWVLAL